MSVKIDESGAVKFAVQLLEAIRDRKVTLEELQGLAETAFDAVDLDPREVLALAVDELEDLLTRDPARIRERAAEVRQRNPARADRMEARADRIQARQDES